MGFSYLKDKNWADITREERYFCAHLYFTLLDKERRRIFLTFLKKSNSPFPKLIPESSIEKILIDDNWEIGFEVCFYRDLLLQYGISVKKNNIEIDNKQKMIKRTFDLCLFNKTTIIIIEAKCLSNLDKKQYTDFKLDKRFIETMYDYLKQKQILIELPTNIYTVFLAPSSYYESVSFIKINGIGSKIINDYQNQQKFSFDKFISWKQIDGLDFETTSPNIFKLANGNKSD